ncbi:hypothetical protein H0H81_012350 [Sphagnurus paluster]|uniref:CDC20/Fizzy WD40 domain-containing protein n=1 Tax=Sphagnurus paluster TaxID=117069 RepID=A0A9P7GNY8_9AGAR|nr:hypothetical protein H0H81_012350 [Sphagnurus paluster]
MPPRKRANSYASVSKFSSVKRRRMSMLGGDLDLQPDHIGESTLRPANCVDRFVPSRPKNAIPLNVTPRTNRISRQFGLVDTRVFSFKGEQPENVSEDNQMYGMLRKSVSQLFHAPPTPRPSSVTENLTKRQQCVLTLDGPGISKDPHASPITWSRTNLIAVACGSDVFYQNLRTRAVHRLCKLEVGVPGELRTIEWAGAGREYTLALGTSTGVVQVWDAGAGTGGGAMVRMWRQSQVTGTGIGGLDWNKDFLAVGSYDGTISLFDLRAKTEARRVTAHKGKVLGVKWSADGSLMASGDDMGMVYIWDKRAGKQLLEEGTQGSKMRHRGPVKALAWCPWKPDLLATGSIYPEGKIRVWSSLSPSALPKPLETIDLDTSVLSLHWSPHCKELLSTHGSSFEPPPVPARGATATPLSRAPLKAVSTLLSNSIAVHEYPSGKRLLTLTNAHYGPVTHSCMGPNGEDLFTVCPREETIKKWHVWSKRPDAGKKESAFDKWSIR